MSLINSNMSEEQEFISLLKSSKVLSCNESMYDLIYPTLFFTIDIHIDKLKEVLSYDEYIYIICDDQCSIEQYKVLNKRKSIIVEDVINYLDDTSYFPLINTCLVDIVKIEDNVFKLIFEN